jgi:hypothetical protein
MSKSKAFTFGASRDAYDKVYTPSQKFHVDKNIPGPGTYPQACYFGKEGRKFTF